ncbi:MAG: HAD-IB family phosphatase [Thaumarchaeota archaeon]|nr:HAD-IB family phosphatase [Nitrososphaerota archaeon]
MSDKTAKKVVAADFDGTLLKNDLAELVLARFAGEGWKRYDELLAKEKISLEECMRRQYAMVEVGSRREVIEYVDRYCTFRPGVKKLVSECEARGIDLVIVSAGLDFCIRHAFRKNGIGLPKLVCPRSSFGKGKGFGVTFPARRSPGSADYKESFVSSCQGRGMSVTFVGNGMGDLHAAIRADEVFAIKDSTLDVVCNERGIAHESVKNLVPVWKSLLA